MKPAAFTYHAPTTVDEAVALLSRLAPEDGRVLAGGQSLVPTMAFRLARPQHLVDINGIAALRMVAVEDGVLRIGAGVRHAAFHEPVEPGPLGRLLAMVVRHIAHHPIRTRGTFCGSIAHADPASEWCAVAAALDARMVAVSSRGARTIAAAEYFQGIMTTALAEDELLTEVHLPLLPAETRVGFNEFNRRAGDYAWAMGIATYRLDGGVIAEPRIATGGAEASPRRLAEVEAMLTGETPSPALFKAAAERVTALVDPLDDPSIPRAYRASLAGTVVRRALESAAR